LIFLTLFCITKIIDYISPIDFRKILMFIKETLFNFYLNRTRIVVHDFIEYIYSCAILLVHEDFAY